MIGQFYGEFLRYAGGDKKALGIVLTPRHLAELFVKMVAISLNDTVVDTCCGTGGFLIAAMAEMDALAAGDADLRKDIRMRRLIGIEQQPHMFALAASNMILRGDGKANLFQGSCFAPEIAKSLIGPDVGMFERPTIGLINPPFAQRGEGLHELDFVLKLLDVLRPGGRAIVVLPMSCAIEPHPLREAILAEHTLVASVSLPNDLFSPMGVITCALVFEAHQRHADSPRGTWFGAWKDDGFVKKKHRGRVDDDGTWPAIRNRWLTDFHERVTVPGRSAVQRVGAKDEWCVEAYLETDYGALSAQDFAARVREYFIFQAVALADALAEDPGPADGDD